MQPTDPADPRKPNVKVAASIRAAILSGELEPGTRLPSVHELAGFFAVSAGTIHAAVRTLRDEGFVRSLAGSGNYVRDQASIPVPAEDEHPLAGTAGFLYEMGQLKNLPRAGWLLLGIPLPESVAEHSFRAAVVGMTLAAIEGADVGRTAALCLFHDAHETRIGDVPAVGRAYITTAAPEAVTAHQTSAMPDAAAKVVQDLVAEYEANETLEARLAHDADKVETLLQAAEYQTQGYNTEPWRETSLAALRTDAGRQLARAIGAADPHGWWAAFAASYHELRASTRAHAPEADPD
jgi:putative hydrolases of HD superfamily